MADFAISYHFRKRPTRGEDLRPEVILAKRREFERENPDYPKWNGPEGNMSSNYFQKDGGSPQDRLDGVIRDLRKNVIGKNVATMRAKRIFDDHLHKVDATDASGKELSNAQQWVRWTQKSPQGVRFSEGLAAANESTQAEQDAEVRAQAAHDGVEPLDQRTSAQPVAKKETTTASPAYLRLEKMARSLQARLRAEQGVEWTVEKCFSFLVQNVDGAKELMKEDRVARLGPSFADVA